MAKDTKERILATALDLFSQNGYAGTNIRELTASVGMVKSSIYKHFESKEDIWNALLDEMISYYDARFSSPERLPRVPDSLEGLVEMTMRLVDFTAHDPITQGFRGCADDRAPENENEPSLGSLREDRAVAHMKEYC